MSVLYLCGAGNPEGVRLAQRIQARQSRWDRLVLLDDDVARHGRSILGVEIAGPLSMLSAAPRDSQVQSLVARTTRKRRAVHEILARHGLRLAGLVHPNVDTDGVQVDPDVVVYEQALLGPEVVVGSGVVVFMGAVLGHESRIGPGCVIASNAVLNARVELGEGVYVGTNATILPEVKVGDWATIGAGAVVVQDVPAGATVSSAPVDVVLAPPAPATANAPAEEARLAADEVSCELPLQSRKGDEDAMEALVACAWRDVLRRDCGPEERFFDVGGSSLLAVCLVERLRRSTGQNLALTDAYRFVTVRAMARYLCLRASGEAALQPVPLQRRAVARPRVSR